MLLKRHTRLPYAFLAFLSHLDRCFFLCEGTLNFDYLRIKIVFMRKESRPMITDPDTDKKTDGQSNPNQQKNK